MRYSALRRIFVLSFALFAFVLAAAPEGRFDWNTARRIDANIRHKEIRITEPRLVVLNVVRVKLSPKMFFVSYPKAEGYGQPMPDFPSQPIVTLRKRVADFMLEAQQQHRDMRMAINAAPWTPWTDPYTHKYAANTGLSINLGEVVELPKKRAVPSLVMTRSGKVMMRTYAPGDKVADLKFAVSGFDFILKAGEVLNVDNKALAPRTYYGISQDGKTLYFITADGRQKGYSEGMTVREGGEWLRYLGAYDGINMDGGGSTTLCFWDGQKKAPQVMNHQGGGATRLVGNAMGICYHK